MKQLTKATGEDSIPTEYKTEIGVLDPKRIQLVTRLINKIHNTGKFSADFLQTFSLQCQKYKKNNVQCSDYRTISLIPHTSNILLHLIKRRIMPIVENYLAESQNNEFSKWKGTRDTIFQLKTIAERGIQVTILVLSTIKKLLTG